jgi:hypothetical protein
MLLKRQLREIVFNLFGPNVEGLVKGFKNVSLCFKISWDLAKVSLI